MVRRKLVLFMVIATAFLGSCAGSEQTVGRLPDAMGDNTRVLVRIFDERSQTNAFTADVNLRQLLLNRLVEEMQKRNFRPHIRYRDPESLLEIQIRDFRFQSKSVILGGMELISALKASCSSSNRGYESMFKEDYVLSPGAVRAAVTDPKRIERREIERMIPKLVDKIMKDEKLLHCLARS